MTPDPDIHCRHDAIIPRQQLRALIHARNPNRHKQKQIDLIGHVIETLGWRHPIVISNLSGQAVAGNGRIYATIARQWSGAPVVYQDFADEEAEKAFLLADNRLAELSDRDDTAVAALLKEISASGFDTLLSGYDGASIDKLLGKLGGTGTMEEGTDSAPDPNALLAAKWATAAGQIWQLGEHRLGITDAAAPASWDLLMPGETGHLVFTDPPYGVDYTDSKGRSIEGDKLQRDDLAALIRGALILAADRTHPDTPFYIWHASSTRDDFSFAMKAAGIGERQYLTWVKDGFVLGHEDFHWQTEHAFYAAKIGQTPRYFGDRSQSTLWRIAGQDPGAGVIVNREGILITDGHGRHLLIKETPPPKSSGKIRHFRVPAGETLVVQPGEGTTAWCIARDPTAEYIHPNQKPAALAARAIVLSSQPGDIVVDMFAGSGSTMIACEQHGRKARIMEKCPLKAAAIIERWSAFAPKKTASQAA